MDKVAQNNPNLDNLELPHPNPDSFLKVALFSALVACGMALYLFWQNQQLSYQLTLSRQEAASPSPTPSPITTPAVQPSISNIQENGVITSPVSIKGTVPSSWMFEGQFFIEIRDSEGRVLGSGVGKEVNPGDWSSGKPVDFSANITFKTDAKRGILVLLSNNPSGLPENQKTFSLPVRFE